jgi:hypothetical protein
MHARARAHRYLFPLLSSAKKLLNFLVFLNQISDRLGSGIFSSRPLTYTRACLYLAKLVCYVDLN